MDSVELFNANPIALAVAVFAIGLIIGSFLNVVIYRLPIMMRQSWIKEAAEISDVHASDDGVTDPFNLIRPSSTCPKCGSSIKPWHNIPIISYILLRGQCANCGNAISVRYPIVEFLSGLVASLVALNFHFSFETAALIGFVWFLITLSLIDLDHQLLPDVLTLSLLWIGLILNLNALFIPLESAVIGAAIGYLSLWSVYWVFKLLTGKEGMGYGDFKLFAAFGAWFGWAALPLIILLSSLVGAVVGIAMIAIMGRDRQIPIPFGPYLCGAALVYVFWGDAIMQWYLGSFA